MTAYAQKMLVCYLTRMSPHGGLPLVDGLKPLNEGGVIIRRGRVAGCRSALPTRFERLNTE